MNSIASASQIPVIDLACGSSESAQRRLIAELDFACRTAGFFYVANDGVSPALIAQAFEQSARFFDLPMDEKMAIHLRYSKVRRGYERIGDQQLDEHALPDQKESYYCGLDYPADHPYVLAGYDTYGESQWPSSLPEFAITMKRYMQATLRSSGQLMSLIARALGQRPDYFDAAIQDPMVSLRLLRYPPQAADSDRRMFGAGAHTDWGALTTLAQDAQAGLQVQTPDGQWVSAAPI